MGKKGQEEFEKEFAGKFSEGFLVNTHFKRLGVINQTTMLATETQAIADYLKSLMAKKFGENDLSAHFSDTRDTLCYATNENQDATYGLLQTDADLAIVIGGYNSSNTSHLVELCEKKFPTYFISSANEIESKNLIHHFNYSDKKRISTANFFPDKEAVKVIITSGASCPDSLLEGVITKLNTFGGKIKPLSEVLKFTEVV